MDVQLCQRLLVDHGVFPHEVTHLPLKEKLFMAELYRKEEKEAKERGHSKN